MYALGTEGPFTRDGTFISVPEVPAEPFLKLWQNKLLDLLLAEGRIARQVIDQARTWCKAKGRIDYGQPELQTRTPAIYRIPKEPDRDGAL